MATDDTYRVWGEDAKVLAQVGKYLSEQPTRVQVRLPRNIAAEAVAAWQRDDDEGPLPPETPEQRSIRHSAGTLGLIGLSIETGGVEDGDDVVADLESWLIGLALEATEEAGLLVGPNASTTERPIRAVFLLWHGDDHEGAPDAKVLGVYSSEHAAEDRISRSMSVAGFVDHPEHFHISKYLIDKDEWTEGYVEVD